MKKAQAWSMDIMIAVVIFIGAIFVFYFIFSGNERSKTKELEDDASKVLDNLNITQNLSQLEELLGEDYSDLKNKLRVKNEFCIYLEDENGNIIYVSQDNQAGVGSDKIKISDIPCG